MKASRQIKLLLLFLLLGCAGGWAQDAVRYSIASEQAAAARKRARSQTHYNLDLDPVKLRLDAYAQGEYNDNVNLASVGAKADYIARPQVGIRAFWVVSDQNTLDFDLRLGYEHYFNGARPSRFIVTGDENSGLFFDIYIGDFVIDLHDRFSLSQDPSTDPSVSGIAAIFRLENTLGTTVTWDLNKLVLDLNYDHQNYIPLDDTYKYLNHQSELTSLRAAATLNPALVAGIEFGAGLTRYTEPQLSDNVHASLGPFVRYEFNSRADVRASFGFTRYWFDTSQFITNRFSQSGFYADVTFTHRPTERTAQSLNVGQSLSTDINSSPIQLFYARYSVTLNIIRYWSFRPHVSFESGSESRGLVQEDLTRYGAGLAISRQITEKLDASISYSLLKKDSSEPNFDYNQNRLVLDLIYQF